MKSRNILSDSDSFRKPPTPTPTPQPWLLHCFEKRLAKTLLLPGSSIVDVASQIFHIVIRKADKEIFYAVADATIY